MFLMWARVAHPGGVAGEQRQRGGSVEASLCPSRLGGGRALIDSDTKPFPLIMGLLMAIKYGMTLDLAIK